MSATLRASIAATLLGCAAAPVVLARQLPPDGAVERAEAQAQEVRGELKSLVVVSADPEDFGSVPIGEPLVRKVIFQSVLGVGARIEVVNKTCGCLEAKFSPEVVPAGDVAVLTISTVPVPAPSEQVHAVVFRVSWREGDAEAEETGMVAVRYRPRIAYVVRPEFPLVSGIVGEPVSADVFIRVLEDSPEAMALEKPTCSLPGWSVAPFADEPTGTRIRRFALEGSIPASGVTDGDIVWRVPEGVERALRVPIRLKGLSPYRVFPGGATFVMRGGERGAIQAELVIQPRVRPAAAAPSDVALADAVPWVGVELVAPDRVRVSLVPGEGMPTCGSVRARVLSTAGDVCAEFPIVWWTR